MFSLIWNTVDSTGMDKVREQEAPLPGNGRENWGNHHIDVTEIWRGVGKEGGRRKCREQIFQKKMKWKREGRKEKKNRNWGRGKAKELGKLGWNRFLFPFLLLFLFFETFSLFSSSSFFSYSSSYLSYINVMISSIFPVISWERCSPLPHFIHPCQNQRHPILLHILLKILAIPRLKFCLRKKWKFPFLCQKLKYFLMTLRRRFFKLF